MKSHRAGTTPGRNRFLFIALQLLVGRHAAGSTIPVVVPEIPRHSGYYDRCVKQGDVDKLDHRSSPEQTRLKWPNAIEGVINDHQEHYETAHPVNGRPLNFHHVRGITGWRILRFSVSYGINGRHEETRTPDLYRVKVAL